MTHITVILIEPENPGNIGAIARSMKNFGFSNLLILNPKCDILSSEARNRAKHAQDILESAKIITCESGHEFDFLKEFDSLVATTSKLGSDYNIPRSPITPEQFVLNVYSKDVNALIGLIFGRESLGLTNEEVKKCDYVVSIPTSVKYPALNLSHSVSIFLYELYKSSSNEEKITDGYNVASSSDKEQIEKMLDLVLDKLIFSTDEKKETQRIVWKRVIGKSMLTKREAFAIMGFFKKLI